VSLILKYEFGFAVKVEAGMGELWVVKFGRKQRKATAHPQVRDERLSALKFEKNVFSATTDPVYDSTAKLVSKDLA